jgi:Holliday junction resolvase RusA-like endonuclease
MMPAEMTKAELDAISNELNALAVQPVDGAYPFRAEERRTFLLPVPPSVNNLYVNTPNGRRKSLGYRSWLNEAGWKLKLQNIQPLQARSYQISIAAPVNHARDLGNVLKATEDLIVEMGIISDDRWIDSIHLDRMTEGKEMYVTLKVLA